MKQKKTKYNTFYYLRRPTYVDSFRYTQNGHLDVL